MPDLPRISGRVTVQGLERLGFVLQRQRGSHVVLRRGQTTCVVPMHRELKSGTLRGVLKQADVDLDVFLEALR